MKPVSLQLYSLREASKENFRGVLEDVAEIGYTGVEPAGFYDLDPAEFRKCVEDLGMQVSSSHGPWAKPDNLNEVIETAGVLGINLVSSGFGKEFYSDLDAIKRTAEMVSSMTETLSAAGLRLFLHNHYWEFEKVEGRLAYDIFAEYCPAVLFEIDTYWAANFGAEDPAKQVRKFSSRTPLLHIKDGPLEKDKAMVAAGRGKMDIPAVIAAANPNVLEWVIIELDRCDTDMLTAGRESYKYLVGEGLASGRK